MFRVVLIVASVLLLDGSLPVNGQCTTPGCQGSVGGSDAGVEKILEDHDRKLHDVYRDLRSKIEQNSQQLQVIVKKMAEAYLSTKYNVCPSGFDYLSDAKGCFKVIFDKLNWTEAADECRKLNPGAHLTAVTSQEKQGAISQYLLGQLNESNSKSDTCLFRDGDNWGKGEHTVWTSGQTRDPDQCGVPYEWKILNEIKIPFNYKNWIILEPSCGHTNEHCTQIVRGGDDSFKWNDLNCGRKTCALCEL